MYFSLLPYVFGRCRNKNISKSHNLLPLPPYKALFFFHHSYQNTENWAGTGWIHEKIKKSVSWQNARVELINDVLPDDVKKHQVFSWFFFNQKVILNPRHNDSSVLGKASLKYPRESTLKSFVKEHAIRKDRENCTLRKSTKVVT